MKSIYVLLRPERAQEFEELVSLYELEGVEIRNPEDDMFTNPLWSEEERPEIPKEPCSAVLYGSDEQLEDVLQGLGEMIQSWEYREIPQEDWMKKWADGFTGITAGEKIFIHPPWVEKKEDRVNVCIMPGMAFGTGAHETTRLCAAALEKWLRKDSRVIDVGSGSAVLSLCAAALGAKSVLAIENDPQTFANAQENLSLNDFSSGITLQRGDMLCGIEMSADLILANILPPVLIAMAPQVPGVLRVGGVIILSGILTRRKGEVLRAYTENFDILEEDHLGEWCALVIRRRK